MLLIALCLFLNACCSPTKSLSCLLSEPPVAEELTWVEGRAPWAGSLAPTHGTARKRTRSAHERTCGAARRMATTQGHPH